MTIVNDPATTIQVHRPTVERLKALKVPGLTYEDVINFALDKLSPADVQALYDEWQKDAIAKLAPVARPLQRKKT